MFQRAGTVHVTTKAELDAALASAKADRIVVEGDDDLLTYATKAAAREKNLQIDRVEAGGAVAVSPIVVEQGSSAETTGHETSSLLRKRQLKRWRILVLALGALAIGAILYAFLQAPGPSREQVEEARRSEAMRPPGPRSAPGEAPQAAPSMRPAGPGFISFLAWPVVATVAIIALLWVALRAISAGSNLEISWQVTEKVQGKIVISRISSPAQPE